MSDFSPEPMTVFERDGRTEIDEWPRDIMVDGGLLWATDRVTLKAGVLTIHVDNGSREYDVLRYDWPLDRYECRIKSPAEAEAV